ncbi:MAG: hypothetical protein AAFY71_18095 [Bacteroidota bacterium]
MDKELAKWQKEIEDLELDLKLEEADVIEAFEQHKHNLTESVNSFTKHAGEMLGEGSNLLQGKLDELKVQLALGKAESKDAFEEQRKELDKALHSASEEFEKVKGEAGENVGKLKEEFDEQMNHFKTRLDMFRLHFHLGMAEAKEEYEEKKKDLSQELDKIKEKVDGAEDKAENRLEDFGKEMGEAFSHFQKAVKGLFD